MLYRGLQIADACTISPVIQRKLLCLEVPSMIQLMILLAVAGRRYNPTWLDAVGLKYIQSQHESPHKPHYFRNHANEASAYVQFLHDYLSKVRS